MKKSGGTCENFLLNLFFFLVISLLAITVVFPMLFEAAHKQMTKSEAQASERIAAQNFIRNQ